MKRLISVDIARAICIILVVIGHYYPANSPQWYDTIRKIIYSFHTTFQGFAKSIIIKFTHSQFDIFGNDFIFIIVTLIVIMAGGITPIIFISHWSEIYGEK